MQNDRFSRLRFGVFEANLRTGELTRNGSRLRLQEQPFQLLAMLLEKKGEVVTRDELRSRLWPDTTVDFDHGLNKAVSKIRDALGDSAENPRFVETVARRGYRFLADVAVVGEHPTDIEQQRDFRGVTEAALGEAGNRVPLVQTAFVSRWRLFGGMLAVAMAIVLSWLIFPQRTDVATIHSLVVLPLENLSGDASQEYFADGMTDELISRLGQVSSLRVISRTSAMSYKDVRKPLPEIGRDLDVDGVVEGSVLRSGSRVRIIVRLIHLPNEERLWSHSYNENIQDTLALQSQVTSDIADHVLGTLEPREKASPANGRPLNVKAYDDYLKGRYFWNKRSADGLKTSIAYFSRAVEEAPDYAEAYSGLADAYALSGDWEYGSLSPQDAFTKSKAAASKALSLDDSLSQAHTSLAFVLDLYGWDWEPAEREYRRAIELNPGYATAHHWYAWHLLTLRRNGEGLAELKLAESLDPLSLIISSDLADAFCIDHQYDESLKQSRKTLEMDRNFAVAHYEMGQALVQKNMLAEAIVEFQKAIENSGHSAVFDSNLAYAFALSGRKSEALATVKMLEENPDQYPSAEGNIAMIFVGLGDYDQAMLWLNKAYGARFNPSILLRPAFDALRQDARFRALWVRVGLQKNG